MIASSVGSLTGLLLEGRDAPLDIGNLHCEFCHHAGVVKKREKLRWVNAKCSSDGWHLLDLHAARLILVPVVQRSIKACRVCYLSLRPIAAGAAKEPGECWTLWDDLPALSPQLRHVTYFRGKSGKM